MWEKAYDSFIKKYLSCEYAHIIEEYKNKQPVKLTDLRPFSIWFAWLQGETLMPETVRLCYNALRKNANGNTVILVTWENYQNYVTIPPYILEKVNKGIITATHFSDILRMCLLYEHGGLWMDSTVLLTDSLPVFSCGFYSPKCPCDSWQNVNEKRWLGFFLYMDRGNILAKLVRSIFFEYWKTKEAMIEYYLIDYCIAIAYDHIPAVRAMIDAVQASNAAPHTLQHHLNDAYDPVLFDELKRASFFYKLSRMGNYVEKTETGKLTLYGFLLSKYEELT
jgi:hypothetical protein